jgi:hypothetical protein
MENEKSFDTDKIKLHYNGNIHNSGGPQMNSEQTEPQNNQSLNMIDTTDGFEAVTVFRSLKNLVFLIILISFLLSQLIFWLEFTGRIADGSSDSPAVAVVGLAATEPTDEGELPGQDTTEVEDSGIISPDEMGKGSTKIVDHSEVSSDSQAKEDSDEPFTVMNVWHASHLVRCANFLIVFGAMLYSLTLLVCLKVSLAGSLGGLRHISRAFFFSLVFFVLVLPWQAFYPGVLVGVVYTPGELFNTAMGEGLAKQVLYFGRFVIYWLVAFVILLMAQARSTKWTGATMRRLGMH